MDLAEAGDRPPHGARGGASCPNLPQRPVSSRNAREETLIFRAFLRGRYRRGAPLWQIWTRTGSGPGSDRVRLVPRDPRAPSVSGSASRRPSRGRTWRPGRIVPGRTRLRGRQNRAIMRKPTDTPGAGARTILPGRQNRVRALGPARPRPRRGAPVQQIRTHPAPQAPYAPLRHTQNNLPGVTVPGVTGRQARGAEPQAEVMTVGRGHMSAGRGHGGEWSGPASSPWRPGTRSGVMAALGTTPTGSGAARIGPR